MSQSNNFDPALKQVVNVITDGQPNVCCDTISHCGSSCDLLSAENNSIDARNYLLSNLQLTPKDDRITCEFIGNDSVFRDWIKDQIVWPQPGKIAKPYPSDSGWVRMVQSYQEVEEAIQEKVRISVPTPKSAEKTLSKNSDSVQVGNDEARSIGDYGSTIAVNNLEIEKNQDSGECNSCNKSNLEKIKIGDRKALASDDAIGTNSVKVVTNQQ